MVVQNSNCSDSCKTHRGTPNAPKTLAHRDGKLLEDAQTAAGVVSRQNPSQLLPKGADNHDITIECLQRQLAELTQIVSVTN